LDALIARWTIDENEALADRIAALRAGVAYSGGTARLDAATVSADGANDSLNGGAAEDWFFAKLGEDTLTPPTEELTELP
jgi:hypothetical protein